MGKARDFLPWAVWESQFVKTWPTERRQLNLSEDTPSPAPCFPRPKELTAGPVRNHRRKQWSSVLCPSPVSVPVPFSCCILNNLKQFQVSVLLYVCPCDCCLPCTPFRGIRSHVTRAGVRGGNTWSLLTSSTIWELLVQAQVQHVTRSLQTAAPWKASF